MRLSKLLAAVIAASTLAACSLSNERWSNFDNQPVNVNPQENQAGLVFYRVDSSATSAVNVSVNGQYLSSLQVGGFSQTEICAKPTTIDAQNVAMKQVATLQIKPANQSVHYFQVDASNASKPQITEVDASNAQEALKSLRHQANTISRVTTACTTR